VRSRDDEEEPRTSTPRLRGDCAVARKGSSADEGCSAARRAHPPTPTMQLQFESSTDSGSDTGGGERGRVR